MSTKQGIQALSLFSLLLIVGCVTVFMMGPLSEKQAGHAEYCAEEMVSRKPVDGRLVESRSCRSWVGWPIEIREVKQ